MLDDGKQEVGVNQCFKCLVDADVCFKVARLKVLQASQVTWKISANKLVGLTPGDSCFVIVCQVVLMHP